MKKKELKQRIKELEFENEMLRFLAASTPYSPYWLPYRYQPSPIYDWSPTRVISGTTGIIGDWQIIGSTIICIDYPNDSATLAGQLMSRGVI